MNWWLLGMILAVVALCLYTAYVEFTILGFYRGFFE